MSDHDSGVDSGGEDSGVGLGPRNRLPYNWRLARAGHSPNDDDQMIEDGDDDDGDDDDDVEIFDIHNRIQLQHQQEINNNRIETNSPNSLDIDLNQSFSNSNQNQNSNPDDEIVLILRESSNSDDNGKRISMSDNVEQNDLMLMPSTSRGPSVDNQQHRLMMMPSTSRGPLLPPSLDSNDSMFVMPSSSNSNSSNSFPTSFSICDSPPAAVTPVPVIALQENAKNSQISSKSDLKFELNRLWDNIDTITSQQHCFIPKMKLAKFSRLHRKSQYSTSSLHEERLLRIAVNNGDVNVVRKIILSDKVNVNAADERKRTALHFAVVRGHNDIAWTLLINGADPNVQDIVGNTPLHLAVCSSNLDMVILLLENGANCASSDKNGRTPIHLARSKLMYMSRSFGERKCLPSNSSVTTTDLPEKFKPEVLKISIMLGIYFDKCKIDKKRTDMDVFKNRVETSHTTNEIEKDVNDLLQCLEDWAL